MKNKKLYDSHLLERIRESSFKEEVNTYLKEHKIKPNGFKTIFPVNKEKYGGIWYNVITCPICGNKTELVSSSQHEYSRETISPEKLNCDCYKSCGNIEFLYWCDKGECYYSSLSSLEKLMYIFDVDEVNEIFNFVTFEFQTKYDKTTNEQSCAMGNFFEYAGIFSKKDGLYYLNRSATMQCSNSGVDYVFKNTEIVNSNVVSFLTDIKKEIKEINADVLNQKAIAKLTPSKASVKEETLLKEFSSYTPTPVAKNVMDVIENGSMPLLKTYIQAEGKDTVYKCYCPKCHKIELHSENDLVCSCGHHYLKDDKDSCYNVERADASVAFSYWDVLPNGCLLQRNFCVKYEFNEDYNVDVKCDLESKVYYTLKKTYFFNQDEFTKVDYRDFRGFRYYNTYIEIQNKDELKDIIKNSVFKYSGFIDALGLSAEFPDRKITEVWTTGTNCYLYRWQKMPGVEQILKAGLSQLASSIVYNNNKSLLVNPKASDVCTMLDITKPVLAIAREIDVKPSFLWNLRELWKNDQTLTTKTFLEIRDMVFDKLNDGDSYIYRYYENDFINITNSLIEIKKDLHIDYMSALNYINDVKANQCIESKEAFRLWIDYLKMAKAMNYRLDNHNTKFPLSLKLEHDRAVYSNRVIFNKENKNKFIERAKLNEEKYGGYSLEKMAVVMPKKPEDIISEGVELKHCVGSYVNAVTDGSTCIAFIREKETPDIPLYTAEIKNGAIVEVAGFANVQLKDLPEYVHTFVQKWAKAKNLILAC